ncbi:MAG: response regulator [Campylobacterota bacterium]|nr:response regulator [Campylobacterota bacterium]
MKILIVDDSITARRVAKGFFESIGDYEIIEAQCGVSALDIIKQSSDIDLLFTDIKMPNMDGLELAKILKESEDLSHINIIFMTTEAKKNTSRKL